MKKNIIKGLLISIMTIIAGYTAVIVPFNLFNLLSDSGQRLFFIIEIVVYIIAGSIYLVIKDRDEEQAKKQRRRHEKRKEKIKDVHENWYNIAA